MPRSGDFGFSILDFRFCGATQQTACRAGQGGSERVMVSCPGIGKPLPRPPVFSIFGCRRSMRVCVQRVSEASVTIDGEVVGAIGRGLLVLLGVGQGDGEAHARWLAEKTAGLRIFEDAAGKMNLGLAEIGGAMLVVSQFTLLGDCRRGRRPSFAAAAPPELAERLYQVFVETVRATGVQVATGRFRQTMQVSLVNDGPVTLIIDSADPSVHA